MSLSLLCASTVFGLMPSLIADQVPSYFPLDEDGNGLYDDTERKALLDVFLENAPEFIHNLKAKSTPVTKAATNHQEDFVVGTDAVGGAPVAVETFTSFDMDGDGKVTLIEQTGGRPPLSLLVPESITQTTRKIPWAIDIFPEWISTAYLQDDIAVGSVSTHPSRGVIVRDMTAIMPETQPSKLTPESGVLFAADSGQHFITDGRRDARWDYRWCIFTFRLNAASSEAENTLMIDVNRGDEAGLSSPKIWYNKQTGLNIQITGLNAGGIDRRIVQTNQIATDGETWNVVVCGIRYGQMYASVNGVELQTVSPQPPRFSTDWAEKRETRIGGIDKANVEWAYDSIVFGQTEPSEAMVRKMTGWAAHRLGFAQNLPEGHPYHTHRPFLDLEDFPARYNHDDVAWNAWGKSLRNSAVTRANSGGPRVEPQGFERVFYDDFRAYRIGDSTSGEGDLWTGFGFNTSVGVDAPLVRPSERPKAYLHDAQNQKLNLAIVPQGSDPKRWRSPAIYSNNDLGHGYTWTGPKVFRIRCKFPKFTQKDLPKGLFPAFWSYGIDNIFWRTSNRIEIDYFEFDGANGRWFNGLSTHYHYPYIRNDTNIFAKNRDSYNRFKAFGSELKQEITGIPGGLLVWDGEFHTWEFVIDGDMTYVNMTLKDENGDDRWIEVMRCQTAPTYLEKLNLIMNNALKGKKGKGIPANRDTQDYIIDWVEVLQKSEQIASLPDAYSAHPEIAVDGELQAGATVVCQANVKDTTDTRYFWFADGYPLTYGPADSYTLTAADVGKQIRCMVKAVGARNQPDAWSNILR